jgi:ribosomal protein S27AE
MAQAGEAIPSAMRNGESLGVTARGSGNDGKIEFASEYCPRCSARLAARSCKLSCPRCGYYMSCSDFY